MQARAIADKYGMAISMLAGAVVTDSRKRKQAGRCHVNYVEDLEKGDREDLRTVVFLRATGHVASQFCELASLPGWWSAEISNGVRAHLHQRQEVSKLEHGQ